MNSVILVFSSSGEGNGGGGSCAIKKNIVSKRLLGNTRLKSDSHARDSFMLALIPVFSLSFRAERGISDHFPGNARTSIQRCFAPLNMTTIGFTNIRAPGVSFHLPVRL